MASTDVGVLKRVVFIGGCRPIAPPSQRKHSKQQQPTTVTEPPHCKKCGHPVKGHKRPKGNQVKCEQCPGVYVHLLMLIDAIVTVGGTVQTHRNNFTQSVTSKCYKHPLIN